MWVLFWVAMAGNGALASGSATFDTKAACTRAWTEMEQARAKLGNRLSREGQRGTLVTMETVCLNRQTGAPD